MAKENTAIAKPMESQELIAKIALTGNLAPLNDEQRWNYYQAYCRHLGLDPITRPFDILTTTEKDGAKKVTLYANASCSSQIADNRGVTYAKPEIEYSDFTGTLTVWVKAVLPSGREQWNCGVVHIQALSGRYLENAIKKATTQAHRRATLALCGISMPDESEVEDIAGAQTVQLKTPQHVTLSSPPTTVEDRIAEYLEAAGLDSHEGAIAHAKAMLESGAFQSFAGQVKRPVEEIVQEFGHLAKAPVVEQASEAVAGENAIIQMVGYDGQNRAHGEESAKRFDAVIRRLTICGVKGRDLLRAVNKECGLTREVETRYELSDTEVAMVCETFEAWAQKLETKAAKKTSL